MRRLARRLFTLCSAASLLLCVVVCVLWARSYIVGYWHERQRVVAGPDTASAYHQNLWLAIRPGVLQVVWTRHRDPHELVERGLLPHRVMGDYAYSGSIGENDIAEIGLSADLFARPSFERLPEQPIGITSGGSVVVPLWMVAAALLLGSTGLIPHIRRNSRRVHGLCVQ